MKSAIRQVVGEAAVKPGRIKLDLPPLVENGNTVAMAVTVDSPMTAKDHVKAIHVFTEKNPQPNVISVEARAPRRQGRNPDPRAARRHADRRRHLRNVRRLVLVRHGRRDHHARRLPGGPGLMAARTLINVPPKAKRGEVIQIKTLISHIMETGFRHDNVGKPIPRDIITSFVCTYNGENDFRGRALSGHRRQSVHHVPHRGDRERHARVPMDRRQRLRAGSLRENHGRMRPRARLAVAIAALAAATLPSSGAEIPLERTPLGLRGHEPRQQGDAGRRHQQSRHAGGARRRGAVVGHGRRFGKILRRLPRRRQDQHEGRRGALSGVQ